MSFIDSSAPNAPSPLLAPSPQAQAPGQPGTPSVEDLHEELEEQQKPRPAPRPRESSLEKELKAAPQDENLARRYDTAVLDQLGAKVVREYEIDKKSRSEWEAACNKAMRYAQQVAQPKSTPWPNAANFIYPLIGKSSLEFGSRAYGAVIRGKRVVRGVVWGSDRGTPISTTGEADGPPLMGQGPNGQPMPQWLIAPGEKRKRAERVGEFMSWQLLNEISYWETETDQMLHQIPITGGGIKKSYRDPRSKKLESRFVSLMNCVWNKDAPSFEGAPRHTEHLWLYPYEIREYEYADLDERGEGAFLKISYGAGATPTDETTSGFDTDEDDQAHDPSDDEAPEFFLESHIRYDLDGDDYDEPLTVTVHKATGRVVRIKARWDEDGVEMADADTVARIEPIEYYTLISFLPSLDGGSYPAGWGQLLKALNEGINTSLNQMFDAGTLANSNTGFIGSGLGMASGDVSLTVGRYKRVTTRGGSIRDNVLPLPFQGPSETLFKLLGFLVDSARDVASIQNLLTDGAVTGTTPATTVLAIIEQGMTAYTAIIKRVFKGLGEEYRKLYELNRKHLTEPKSFRLGDEEREITPEDFKAGGGVEPVADPTQTTDMQRLGRAQVLLQFKEDPLVNQQELRRRFFEACNEERIDELLVPPDPMQQQMAQAMMQLEMATKQAELGRVRAAELKDSTQAYLNLAMARAKASEAEQGPLDAQLQYLRLQIEAVNAQTKAEAVRHAYHATNLKAASDHADRLADFQLAGVQPGPAGQFPNAPGPGPAAQPVGRGVQPVAPPSDNAGLPPLPGGPAGGNPTGTPGPLGTGGT